MVAYSGHPYIDQDTPARTARSFAWKDLIAIPVTTYLIIIGIFLTFICVTFTVSYSITLRRTAVHIYILQYYNGYKRLL